jgi:uncharacterized membrane protein
VSGEEQRTDQRPKSAGRVDAIDVARGVALIGMAAFHLSWDLADFRLVSPLLPFTLPMRLLSHTVAGAFLALAGVSLALAHRDRLNLTPFGKRLALVAGAAALVTVGSSVFAPGLAIWFGILHCIAAASLLALPLIKAPAWPSLAAGATAIVLPFLFPSKAFDAPMLLWLGLGEALPNTLDWRPLLPWAGVTLLGLGLARLPGALPWLTRPQRWRARSAPVRSIAFAGRHSLAIYLVHQPILIGVVWAVAVSGLIATTPPPNLNRPAFLTACHRSCINAGGTSDECDASCRCVADAIEQSGNAGREEQGGPQRGREAELRRMVDACMAR